MISAARAIDGVKRAFEISLDQIVEEDAAGFGRIGRGADHRDRARRDQWPDVTLCSVIDTQNDLAELLGRFEVAVRLGGFAQRKHAVDHSFELAAAKERHHDFEIMLGGAVRADDRQLLVKDVVHREWCIRKTWCRRR